MANKIIVVDVVYLKINDLDAWGLISRNWIVAKLIAYLVRRIGDFDESDL